MLIMKKLAALQIRSQKYFIIIYLLLLLAYVNANMPVRVRKENTSFLNFNRQIIC